MMILLYVKPQPTNTIPQPFGVLCVRPSLPWTRGGKRLSNACMGCVHTIATAVGVKENREGEPSRVLRLLRVVDAWYRQYRYHLTAVLLLLFHSFSFIARTCMYDMLP